MDKYVRKALVQLSTSMQETAWRVGSKENDISKLKHVRKIMKNELKQMDNIIDIAKFLEK